MNFKTSVSYFIRNLREKHRLSIRNQHNDSEVWYMYISPLNLLAGFLALVLILFIVITITVAYTPVLDLIPGYPGNKSRTMLIENIIRLDSLEQEVRNMQIYSDNIALIMAGKNPVTRNNVQNSDSLSKKNAAAAATIVEDSLLRRQMETPGGIYSLNDPDAARKTLRSAMELYTPVKGVVTEKFSPIDNRYGTTLATAGNQQVMAVMDGTVVSSSWTPEDGFVLFIQHGGNMLSVYRHNTSVLKKAGERVSSGEIVGYTGGEKSAGGGQNLFEFELWHNGTPIDPEGYIVF